MEKSLRDVRIERVLTDVQRALQEEAEKECPSTALATGDIHGLLSVLAKVFLTSQEQVQVKQIIELHRQCLYPLACK
ncbi:MAG: hypothetical protein JO202_17985 [Ktedonobacteraceae bacterium]|nr:hypothetical protein [Ktedonobacteraceae bacterium]